MYKKKLNILYHFRVRGVGAEGVHIAGIVNGFRVMGHNVRLLSPTNADPTINSGRAYKTDASKSRKTKLLHQLADFLPQPFFEIMEVCYNFFAIIRLLREVKNGGIDFIYERYAFFNIAGAFVSKLMNVPLIVEVNEICGHERIRGQCFVHFCASLEGYVLRQSNLVITVSDFLNVEVRKKIKYDKTKVVSIPNGVTADWIKNEPSSTQIKNLRAQKKLQDKKIICFAGGLVHWHNFNLLLQAVKSVHKIVDDVVMMFIGDGPLRNYIEEKTKKLSLQDDLILFIGRVPHSEMPCLLKISDVAVIPETNEYRSPIKMFEYMAMGLPVVAPRKPAIEVAITHGRDGLLFEPGNYNCLAQKLLTTLTRPEYANKLGENARLKIMRHFTWESHAEHILHILSGRILIK